MNPSHAHKKAAREFFEALAHLIPCPICREHYIKHIATHPIGPHLDRRSDLFRWTLLLHNEVNKSLGKRAFTEAEVLRHYTRLGADGVAGRSPIRTPDDYAAADWAARIQGGVAGAALVGILIGTVYLAS